MSALNLCADEAETAPLPWSIPPAVQQQPSWKSEDFVRIAAAANTISRCVAFPRSEVWRGRVPLCTALITLGKLNEGTGAILLIGETAGNPVRTISAQDSRTAYDNADYLAGSVSIGMTVISARTDFDLCTADRAFLGGVLDSDPLDGYERYAVQNWDGYDADPITAETLAATRRLLRVLPATLGSPAIAPGADGTVGLEWVSNEGPLRKLFIDVGPGNFWSGYWRRSSGEKQSLRASSIDETTGNELRKLFNQLSV